MVKIYRLFNAVNSGHTLFLKTTFNPPIELDRTRKYEMALVTYYSFPNLSDENNVFRYSPSFVEVGRGDEDDSTRQRQWVEVQIPEQGRTQGGGLGLKLPIEFAMLQKRHYLCKGVSVCFRTFFACLMST